MRTTIFTTLLAATFAITLTGCPTTPRTEEKRDQLDANVSATLDEMRAASPTFGDFIDKAYAYAVYPTVGEGGLIVGGAGGRGEVFEKGRMIGYSTLAKATIGAQIGGKAFSEVIAFEDAAALHRFIDREYAFSAEVSAVAIKSGVAHAARFQNGIAVFQYQKGGLMAAAAVGGQQFRFSPVR